MELPAIEDKLRHVVRDGVPLHEPSNLVVAPIRLGGGPIGALAIAGASISDTVLQSVVNLAAIGLERARGLEASARAEAARQSGELRATVLDAVAHEFKTPLTSIKAAVSSLGSQPVPDRLDRELIAIISEETDRLQALVGDAVQMLRIDSGDFVLHCERHRLADLVSATIKESGLHFEGHALIESIPAHLTVDVDGTLVRLALRQLLDNALKYSPPTSTIEVAAKVETMVEVAVRNSGPPIPEYEQARVFERFYRGMQARQVPGTGMGLAIVQRIAQAHGGALAVSSLRGFGTEFRLALPRQSPERGLTSKHQPGNAELAS
jgi:two-component system sensor histidine kinase KdpD